MTVEDNKAIARRFIEEVWNQGRLEVADALLADDLVNHQATGGATTGRDAFKEFIVDFRRAYPTIRFTIDDLLGEGNEVATRVTIHGNTSGQTVTWTGIGIIRLAEGRIVEQWANTDLVHPAAQHVSGGPS